MSEETPREKAKRHNSLLRTYDGLLDLKPETKFDEALIKDQYLDLKSRYADAIDILLKLKSALLMSDFNKELRDYYLDKITELEKKREI